MSVLHESFMFFASLCILDVLLVSFHHASSRFLGVPVCSSSGLLLIGPDASHLATIQRMGKHIAKSSSKQRAQHIITFYCRSEESFFFTHPAGSSVNCHCLHGSEDQEDTVVTTSTIKRKNNMSSPNLQAWGHQGQCGATSPDSPATS